MSQVSTLELSQVARYGDFYSSLQRRLNGLRFDVRYRIRRLRQAFHELGIPTSDQRVLDVGFGAGELLASFPASCQLCGVDVATSAVAGAKRDVRFQRFAAASFYEIPEADPDGLPRSEFDIAVSSHMLEHAADDGRVLRAIHRRLAPDGVLAVFVPLEEPDYIRFHRRNYSLQSITELVERAGFEVLLSEGSMYVNGHLWKWLTVPSRRQWPIAGRLVDALRVGSMSLLPHPALSCADKLLYWLGADARQALVIARKRSTARAGFAA